jgi:RNA polymerase sigma factor (TIGR02999 family)
MSEVTRILDAAAQGDPHAAAELLPLVYDELRRLAAARLAHERPGQTLDATALVHEAYLRLVGAPGASEGEYHSLARAAGAETFANRAHFFAAAAEAMRRILIDRARARTTAKRGGDQQRVSLSDIPTPEPDAQLLALDEALTALEQHDEPAARLVKLRYFAGLSHQEAADALAISRRAADRIWALARAWLYQHIRND